MIELRWLWEWPKAGELPPYTDPAHVKPVLQYRTREWGSSLWGEWQNVPSTEYWNDLGD